MAVLDDAPEQLNAAPAGKPAKSSGLKGLEGGLDFGNIDPGDSGGGSGSSGRRRATVSDYAESQFIQQAASLYVSLWAEPPNPRYLEGLVRKGMNLREIEAHERAKPAFKFSPRYQEERLAVELELSQAFGGLG